MDIKEHTLNVSVYYIVLMRIFYCIRWTEDLTKKSASHEVDAGTPNTRCSMATQGQRMNPYCERRQKISVYSDTLVYAFSSDAVRISVKCYSRMNETQLL